MPHSAEPSSPQDFEHADRRDTEPASGDSSANRRVLLVDDNQQFLESLAALLDSQYEVHLALDVPAAELMLRRHGPFAVVLSDFDMPGENGLEFLTRLRSTEANTSRILLTGLCELELPGRALEEGDIFRFLHKPCSAKVLRSAVMAGIERFQHLELERRHSARFRATSTQLDQLTSTLDASLEQRINALEVLRKFVGQLNHTQSLEQVVQSAILAASQVLGDRPIWIEMHPDEKDSLGLGLCIGPGPAASRSLRADVFSESICCSEGQLGQILVKTDPRLPLTRHDLELLQSIASSTAVAAQNQIHRRERDDTQHSLIQAMARLAEQRDNETGRHLERVSKYCRMLAQGLREDGRHTQTISDAWITDLVRSAPLHDIGKVGIPDSILLKADRLTADEWTVMKTHTVIGADTLRSVAAGGGNAPSFLNMGIDIAWCHHEKWDGSGYPRGLAGEGIPLSARILSVADCYDALTSTRPYKRAWPHAAALQYLLAQSGDQFDPDVVACLSARAQQFDAVHLELADTPCDLQAAQAAPAAVAA